jgi:N-methylhydantoinase A
VTDANLVLGRLNPDYFLGGAMPLFMDYAVDAITPIAEKLGTSLEVASLAIVRLANDNMANAVRLLTLDRGLDHREFLLMAFGGAGPVHAADVALELGMPQVIIPIYPGLTSAFGITVATPRVDRRLTRGLNTVAPMGDADIVAELRGPFDAMVAEAVAEIRREGYTAEVQVLRTVSMRYMGQNYEQEIPVPEGDISQDTLRTVIERFHLQHHAFYGYAMRDNICELAQLNVTVQGLPNRPPLPAVSSRGTAAPSHSRRVYFHHEGWVETPIYERKSLGAGVKIAGPAVVQEPDSTTIISPSHELSMDEHGVLFLAVVSAEGELQ